MSIGRLLAGVVHVSHRLGGCADQSEAAIGELGQVGAVGIDLEEVPGGVFVPLVAEIQVLQGFRPGRLGEGKEDGLAVERGKGRI